jgi:hypothetical protein
MNTPEQHYTWMLPGHQTNDVSSCSPQTNFPGVLPGWQDEDPGTALHHAASRSSCQRRERLFTTQKFPRVLPGGQDEDHPKRPQMSTGKLIFTQPAIPGKRGLQSGKKDCSLSQH